MGSGIGTPARRPSSRSHHLHGDCAAMDPVDGDHLGHSSNDDPSVATI